MLFKVLLIASFVLIVQLVSIILNAGMKNITPDQSAYRTAITVGILVLLICVYEIFASPLTAVSTIKWTIEYGLVLVLLLSALTWGIFELIRGKKRGIRVVAWIIVVSEFLLLGYYSTVFLNRVTVLKKANSSNTEQSELTRIFNQAILENDNEVLRSIASNPSLVPYMAERLNGYRDRGIDHKKWLNVSYSGIDLSNVAVIYCLASNPSTPLQVLARLAKNDLLASRVSRNPNTSKKLLLEMIDSKIVNVRVGVAYNRKTGEKELAKLSNDNSTYVRLAVMENPNISVDILKRLASDPDGNVRERALERLDKSISRLKTRRRAKE